MTTVPFLAPAAGLAWLVAWRAPSPRQRAIAATLTGLLAINVFHPAPTSWVSLDVVACALWYALTAGAVWSVLKSEPRSGGSTEAGHPDRGSTAWARRLAFLGPPILLGAAVLASPIAYRHGVDVGRASFALALAAQLVAAARFASRGVAPDDAQRVALVLVASSFADAFGPWLQGEASRDWRIGTIPAVVTWLIVAGWEARCLIRSK